MRAVLACVAMLVATRAYADDPQPPPGAPPPSDAPQTDKPAPPEPKADPAYGEQPDASSGRGPGADQPQCKDGPCADGGANYFAAPAGRDITIKSYADRSRTNIVALSIVAGVGVVMGGVGAYYHLDSRDESDKINAHKFTGEAWTPERAEIYDNAHSSAVKAGVFYGIGSALLVGTAIAFIVTEPKMETIVIHPHTDPKPTALIAPTRGGALVGGTWSF
jgi:hypothetical protein